MRKLIFVLTIFTSIQVFSQNINEKLSKLKAPSSPASIIIGNQPTVISKPKSWQALEASLYSSYLNQNGSFVVPNDYAIEFSPYWSTKNSNSLSIKEFAAPSVAQTLLQNLSFSVSSTKNFVIKDDLKTDAIGLGLRTMLWQGTKKEIDFLINGVSLIHVKQALTNFIIQRVTQLTGNYSSKTEFISKLITLMESDKKIFISAAPEFLNSQNFKSWLNLFKEKLENELPEGENDYSDEVSNNLDSFTELDTDAKKVEALIQDRQGFRLEIASAVALNFPTNRTDFSYAPKMSVWLTPSYQPFQNNNLEFLGVLKYTWLNNDFYKNYGIENNYYDTYLDYGTRIVYKIDKFSIELELVGRHNKVILEKTKDEDGVITEKSKTENDFQYVLNFNYRISDSIILSYNFGSEFKPTFQSSNTLISLATLNFGITGPKKIGN